MRLTAQVSSEVATWFEEFDYKSIKAALADLKSSFIFLNGQDDFEKSCLEYVSECEDERVRALLQAFIGGTPRSSHEPFTYRDYSVGTQDPVSCTFDEISEDPSLSWLLNDRQADPSPREARQAVFDRCFAPLARVADEIRIIDRYAAKALTDPTIRDGQWLLENLMAASDAEITIFSVPPAWVQDKKIQNGSRPDPKLPFLEASLRFGVKGLRDSQPGFKGNVKVRLNSRLRHNRRINFRFRTHSVTLNLEKGLQTFSSPKMPEDTTFFTKDLSNNFESRVKDIEREKPVLLLEF